MKHRITYITSPDVRLSKDALDLKLDGLKIRDLQAAREDKLTFDFAELPSEVQNVFLDFHRFEIRWDRGWPVDNIGDNPFSARLPSGLHIFFTPRRTSTKLCPLLYKLFGQAANCSNHKDTFTNLKDDDWQLYVPLDNSALFIKNLRQLVCPSGSQACSNTITQYIAATYFDFSYESTGSSKSISANIYTSSKVQPTKQAIQGNSYIIPKPRLRNDYIPSSRGSGKVEVGVFSRGGEGGPEELSLGGLIAVIGDNKEFEPTLFSFPSRHHPYLGSNYTCRFEEPTGLHPKLQINIHGRAPPPMEEECTLNVYLTVPQPFFVDPYQLADKSIMQSMGIKSVSSVIGETDLEAPVWTMKKWGASLMLEIDTSAAEWTATLPLHMRYLAPQDKKTEGEAEMPWPVVFWSCPSEHSAKFAANPFDRRNLGWEVWYGQQEPVLYHLSTGTRKTGKPMLSVTVPTLDSSYAQIIEIGTVFVVVAGFLWVLGKIASRVRLGSSRQVHAAKKVQ